MSEPGIGPLGEEMPSDEALEKAEKELEKGRDRQEKFLLHRAEESKRLLEEPLLVEAFNLLDTQWKAERDALGPDAFSEFKELQLKLRILATVKGELRITMETGKLVAKTRGDRLEMEDAIAKERRVNG